jgi:hypothetical protein
MFPGHVRALTLFLGKPSLTGLIRLPCPVLVTPVGHVQPRDWINPTPGLDMFSLSALSRVKGPESDMSGSQAGFKRGLLDMSGSLIP